MFAKKNAQPEEQIMQDITDEQLSQVTGGGLAGSLVGSLTGNGIGGLGTATSLVTGLVSSVNVSGVQVNAAGVSVSTPAFSTDGVISGLL